MSRLFKYKFPTTKRWYIRHKLDNHISGTFFITTLVTWFLFLFWAYMLLN